MTSIPEVCSLPDSLGVPMLRYSPVSEAPGQAILLANRCRQKRSKRDGHNAGDSPDRFNATHIAY